MNPRPKCECPCDHCKTTQHCKNRAMGCTRKTNRRTAAERAAGVDDAVIRRRKQDASNRRTDKYRAKQGDPIKQAEPWEVVGVAASGKTYYLPATCEEEAQRMADNLLRQGWQKATAQVLDVLG